MPPSNHHITVTLMVHPEGTRDGDKLPTAKPIRQAAAADTPDGVPEETQDEKTEDTGPRELRCISKG